MKVVQDGWLVRPFEVIQIIKEDERVTAGKLDERTKELLKVDNLSMQRVELVSLCRFSLLGLALAFLRDLVLHLRFCGRTNLDADFTD